MKPKPLVALNHFTVPVATLCIPDRLESAERAETPVDSVDSLRSALDTLKAAEALVLQVERLGSLHYVVLEIEK